MENSHRCESYAIDVRAMISIGDGPHGGGIRVRCCHAGQGGRSRFALHSVLGNLQEPILAGQDQ